MKIDMHCHVKEGSVDSRVGLDEYITLLKKQGFQGMVITDHDTYQGYRYWKNTIKGKKHEETCVLLGREKSTDDIVYAYIDYEPKDNEYLKGMKGNATYAQIKEWVKAEYGLKESALYIAQTKDKCGFEKRENYNLGTGKRVPQCPPEKEKAIMAAFKHFNMV